MLKEGVITLTDLNLEETEKVLKDFFLSCSFSIPSYKIKEIYRWLCKGAVFEEMTSLSKEIRVKLEAAFNAQGAEIIKQLNSKDGSVKFLFSLADGNVVEGVLMPYKYGNTLCVSTQVGCRMGCAFCASAIGGLVRNLSVGEMFSFVALANKTAQESRFCGGKNEGETADGYTCGVGKKSVGTDGFGALERETDFKKDINTADKDGGKSGGKGRGVTNVVLMGSGEPLDNYGNVIAFLKRLSEKEGLNMSPRNFSLSTCGLAPQILALAEEGLPVNLTVSLHASIQSKRQELMPVAKQYPISQVISAAKNYFEKTGRRVIFEYTLVKGANDKEEDAVNLAKLLKGFPNHVNLIRLSPVKEKDLKATSKEDAYKFQKKLTELNVSATVRRQMGLDISGACGQLRRKFVGDNNHVFNPKQL